MKQLILVEGLPGTGKSTITKWLNTCLEEKGKQTMVLFEGDERLPLDFYETAGIPLSVFHEMCIDYPVLKQHLPNVLTTKNYIYFRMDQCPKEFESILRPWDMGDEGNSKISVNEYIPCALERLKNWVEWERDRKNIILFDSGFMQNPINELLFRNATDTQVQSYIYQISNYLKPLSPFCIYLKRNSADKAIHFAKKVKGEGWAKGVDSLLAWKGHENHFERRFALEMSLLSLDLLPYIICDVAEDNWSNAKDIILNTLEFLL